MPALKLVDQSLVATGIDLTAVVAIRQNEGKWEFKEFPVLALIAKRLRATAELPDFEDVIEYGYLVTDGASAPVELEKVSEGASAVKVFKSSALPLTDFLKHQLINSAAGHARPLSGILQNPSRANLPPLRIS